jgi:hypothetical protein
MTVYAVTPIQHGEADGKVKHFAVGDTLSESVFGEEGLASLIAGGSAVEVGKTRKYTEVPAGAGTVDEETRKRDELLFKAASGSDDPSPAAAEAAAQGALAEQAENQEAANELKAAGK